MDDTQSLRPPSSISSSSWIWWCLLPSTLHLLGVSLCRKSAGDRDSYTLGMFLGLTVGYGVSFLVSSLHVVYMSQFPPGFLLIH